MELYSLPLFLSTTALILVMSELIHFFTTHLLMLNDCKTAYKYALAFTHTKCNSIDWFRWNDLRSGEDRCNGSVLALYRRSNVPNCQIENVHHIATIYQGSVA